MGWHHYFFLVVKGPAADATDALQPWGLLYNLVMKMTMMIIIFCPFPSNGAPVEWNWHGKAEELGEKTCPSATLSTTNPTWTDPGSNPGLRCGRPAANRLSHGTAEITIYCKTSTLSLGPTQTPVHGMSRFFPYQVRVRCEIYRSPVSYAGVKMSLAILLPPPPYVFTLWIGATVILYKSPLLCLQESANGTYPGLLETKRVSTLR
jgi:hypothetical protein